MLDIKFIQENSDLVKEAARKKHIIFDVDALLDADYKRRTLLLAVEKKRSEQNEYSKKITNARPEEKLMLITEMQEVKAKLQKEEEELKAIMKTWQTLMVAVPNIPDMSVPEGESDKDNLQVRTWGDIPKFEFEPKDHITLMQNLNMLDIERGTKIAGFRGYVLKNEGMTLSLALWQFTLNFFIKKGFTPMMVPSLVRRETLLGTGYLPQGEEDLYKTQDNDYLAGTAEVGVMGYFMDDVIAREKLPIKIIAFSPCFRREAGSHGKDTRGLIRVHEFYKMEQIILSEASHQASVALHEEITANAEELMQALGLPYRVVANCGGDLGLGQVKKYDIEAWVPSEKAYRETHSASYFHDFQARRLNIRYKGEDGKMTFVHSLNSTALPTPRPLVPLIEINQRADGTVLVPKALQPFLGKEVIDLP